MIGERMRNGKIKGGTGTSKSGGIRGMFPFKTVTEKQGGNGRTVLVRAKGGSAACSDILAIDSLL